MAERDSSATATARLGPGDPPTDLAAGDQAARGDGGGRYGLLRPEARSIHGRVAGRVGGRVQGNREGWGRGVGDCGDVDHGVGPFWGEESDRAEDKQLQELDQMDDDGCSSWGERHLRMEHTPPWSSHTSFVWQLIHLCLSELHRALGFVPNPPPSMGHP